MSRFRKLPIEVDAVHCEVVEQIHTLEGCMIALPGDWIITGVNGERYPCKDEIFRKTYEPVEATA